MIDKRLNVKSVIERLLKKLSGNYTGTGLETILIYLNLLSRKGRNIDDFL